MTIDHASTSIRRRRQHLAAEAVDCI